MKVIVLVEVVVTFSGESTHGGNDGNESIGGGGGSIYGGDAHGGNGEVNSSVGDGGG